nr:unnamed protein product [Callosobruchus analis]
MDTYAKLQSVHLSSKIHNSKVKNRQKFITKMIDAYNKQEISHFHFIKFFHCTVLYITTITTIISISLLNPSDVGDCLDINPSVTQPICKKLTQFADYADYLVQTYISGDATFPLCIWADHSSGVERTTNACEPFH